MKDYGPQHWWPGDTPFEVIVGAVLTQNTAWTNVERAIANLKDAGCLSPRAICDLPQTELAQLLRPSGYFNVKARRLKNTCEWVLRHRGLKRLAKVDTEELRLSLLDINGVGPETADDILLYGFKRPVFVIDSYTRRLFSRLGLVVGDEDYETLRRWFEEGLPADQQLFNEYHALIVRHAKETCRKSPRCVECCLAGQCAWS